MCLLSQPMLASQGLLMYLRIIQVVFIVAYESVNQESMALLCLDFLGKLFTGQKTSSFICMFCLVDMDNVVHNNGA
uniref:Uncharacterized protein LOC103427491 isoform X2 n=1 Tax=Rhizophora mucronata TaxID=61149 RepID=A0A2P2KRT0_RHIMU